MESELNKLFGEGGPPWSNRPRSDGRVFKWIIAGVALLFLLPLLWPFVLVGAGERAVLFNRFSGTQRGQLGEGLHVVIPLVHHATLYDVKAQTYTMSAASTESNVQAGAQNDALEALTADGLPVFLEISVRFHPDPENVWKLHREIGPDYLGKIVRPQTRSHVRMVVAQYPVVDVYGPRRARIIEQINARLRTLLIQNYVVLDEVLLRDVAFSPQFQAAIEQKQVAQQDVSRLAFERDRADKERRRKIIEAEGQAESIRLKAAALAQNPGLTQYEYVQNLPSNVKTIVSDSRTLVNLGDVPNAAAVASETPAPTPVPTAPPENQVQNTEATQ
ncbi:MAG: prohibitin family protein [Armatimonadetes bacterium]|nr:prohibitin family protein [Armatimonadota bacterium]